MKNHPIDEEFARKLANHRLEPSSKALEKFQERLSKQSKPTIPIVWQTNRKWFYMAASMLVVGTSVLYMFDFREKDMATNVINSESKKDLAKSSPVILIEKKEIPTIDSESTASIANSLDNQSTQLIKETPSQLFVEDNTQELEPFSEKNTLVFEELGSEIQKQKEVSSNQNVFKEDIGKSVIVLLEPAPETSILIEEMDADSELALSEATEIMENKEEENKSFIGKLFKEYKNLKYGKEEMGLTTVKVNFSETSAPIVSELGEVRDFMQRKIGRLHRDK